MIKRWLPAFLFALWFTIWATPISPAQEVSSQQPSGENQEKERIALEEKAVALLDQVVAESAALRLPENRIRLQITAADLLWERNEERSRALFNGVATALIELMGQQTLSSYNRQSPTARQNFANYSQSRVSTTQLRQELVLTAARHNATLAYQLLQATQSPMMPPDPQNNRQANMDASLEQRLLAQIARTDPQLALKNAEEMLDKGQYPGSLAQVLAQLQLKDKDAAAKLSEKLVKRLQMENLLAKQDASNLALNLLRQGPRPADNAADATKVRVTNSSPVLGETAFISLLEALIAAALKATPTPPGTGRGQNRRGGGNSAQASQNAAQMEQNTARILLAGLQSLLPQIDKYLPSRSTTVRQKLTQMGMDNNRRNSFNQFGELMRQGTSDTIMAAAATAQPDIQAALYYQAALKAIAEGNTDRARQIANDHLNAAQRSVVLQRIETQKLALKTGDEAMESIRQALARLATDEERIRMLLQLAGATQKDNPKLALQILTEAQRLVSGRLSSYQQFDSQLQVARAFAALDPARSFEVLEPGINQLNELFPAALLLSGFEVNIFRDGELPLQEGSRLSQMVNQYAEALASLAVRDFERAQITAEKFQLLEVRIFTRLTIVRGILGGQSANSNRFGNRDFSPNMPFTRRQQ